MAACIPDFMSLRGLRSFGVGRIYTTAHAMAAAAEGASGNRARRSCISRRSHQTQADHFWPEMDTPRPARPRIDLEAEHDELRG